jgi:AcrR family transcriptional regulator
MAKSAKKPLGRRPGESTTREAIAASARKMFAARGYDRTTFRAIAADAGVDPALVNHYFGAKKDLFAAVTALPVELGEVVPRIFDGPRSKMGLRLATFFLETLEQEDSRAAITGIIRAAASQPEAADAVRQVVTARVLDPVSEHLDEDNARLRANLVNSQMVGLVMTRYVIGLEPLASMDPERVAEAIAPNLQRYLTGSLPT